jgi:N-acyl-D-amino-acid deacylase
MKLQRLRGIFWGAVFRAFWHSRRERGPGLRFHTILRSGTVYDGSGADPYIADIGIAQGRIAAIGDLSNEKARQEFDLRGLAVAPGFINPLSWATESLIADPHSESDIRQGVTLEVFGEGVSMGPLTAGMRAEMLARQGDVSYPIDWSTLGEYLEFLERRGIAPNIASFVGATTLRIHEIGHQRRPASATELERMQALVRQAMREGALGVGSALIYAPAAWAEPRELQALAMAAAETGGCYATHVRSETQGLLAAIDEAIEIARQTRQHVEIHHLKAAGRTNWPLMPAALDAIEAARAEGFSLAANMYPYDAAASGLDASMPLWCQEGGQTQWLARLRQPELRARIEREILAAGADWENFYAAAGSAELVRVLGLRNPRLQRYSGMTLAEIAQQRRQAPQSALVDLVLEDESRVAAAYVLMSEDNIEMQLRRPWVSICSDEESLSAHSDFARHYPHPRAYGAFARFLGRYVRERQLMPLQEAIRRMTHRPASDLKLTGRGRIAPDCHADLVVFDAASVADCATYAAPRQFATGIVHVFVNGVPVLREGTLTGARPGRIVRGPGFQPRTLELPRAAG